MNRTHTLRLVLGGLLMLPWLTCGQWVAFNDHVPGAVGNETHINATYYNAFYVPTNTGLLKDIVAGTNVPVTMTYILTGDVGWSPTAGVPNPGTPLHTNFSGYVFFGTKTDSVIQIASGEMVTITFTGLNPDKRFSFRGGAVRGAVTYTNRWTLATLEGAATSISAHTDGALTTAQVASIPANAAAINTGFNLAGDMWDWENIDPGSDGAISIVCSQYTGAVPNGGSSAGPYAYGISGIRLEEISPTGPIAIVQQPTNATVVVGEPLTLDIEVTGELPYYYQWFNGTIPGVAIVGATNETFTKAGSTLSDDGYYYAIVSNQTTCATSYVAKVTMITGYPIVITGQPSTTNNVPPGSSLTLSVVVTGTRPQYQWFKSPSIRIPDATNAFYTIPNVTSADAGRYFVQVSNIVNIAVSSDSVVTVLTNGSVLFVSRTPLSPGDSVISNRIAVANYVVVVQDDRSSASSHATGKAFVFISSSVDSAQIGNKFMAVAEPVIVCEPGIFNSMFMTTGNATNLQGVILGQQGVSIYDETHPLAGGLTRTFPVYDNPDKMGYGYVGGGGIAVATSTNGSGFPVIFAYEKGTYLALGNTVLPAAARRVGLFFDSAAATNLTAQATVLLNSSITWATCTPPTTSRWRSRSNRPVLASSRGRLPLSTSTSVAPRDITFNGAKTAFLSPVATPAITPPHLSLRPIMALSLPCS